MTKTAFRQADVARAVKGVKAAGVEVGRVEVGRDGRVIVYSVSAAKQTDLSPLDKWRHDSGQG